MTPSYRSQQEVLIAQVRASIAARDFPESEVTPVENYETDPRMCLTSVAFPSKEIAARIMSEVIEPLCAIEPEHYFLPADSLHLTVKAIRVVAYPLAYTAADVARVCTVFARVVPQQHAYKIPLEGVIRFPNSIAVLGFTPESSRQLTEALDAELSVIGMTDDKIYYSSDVSFANITVCRFAHEPGEAFMKKVHELEHLTFGELAVTEINLMEFNLVNFAGSRIVHGTYQLI